MAGTIFTPNTVQRGLLEVFRQEYLRIHVAQDTFLPECVLATYVANKFHFSPVWLLIVGPPSSGKTAVLEILGELPDIHEASTVTAAGLLSGSPKRERQPDSTGGVLREVGSYGVLVVKDFTSILSMGRDSKAEVLAALRDIYDGKWNRRIGSDGGRTEAWEGKLGFVGAVTQTIDMMHTAMSIMGERFVLFRIPSDRNQSLLMARRTLENVSPWNRGVIQLRTLAKSIIDLAEIPEEQPGPLPKGIEDVLISLSLLVTSCRTGVERDGYGSRDILHIPSHEEPSRLAQQLSTLYRGLLAIGNTPEEALARVKKVGLDSIPGLRRRAIFELRGADAHLLTRDMAERCKHPETTTRRALEELRYLGIVSAVENPAAWRLETWVCEHIDAIEIDPVGLEEVPFEVVDLIDAPATPEKGVTPLSINAANTVGTNRVSPPPQNKPLREHVKRNQERSRNASAN